MAVLKGIHLRLWSRVICSVLGSLLVACGGGSSSTKNSTAPTAASYTVSGTVTGLTANGLSVELRYGTSSKVAIVLASGANSFAFSQTLVAGSSYQVAISSQPVGLSCTVGNASGTANADVKNVTIACSATSSTNFTVGGSASGLTASGLTLALRYNGSFSVSLDVPSGSSTFVFGQSIPSGATYQVVILSQPSGQSCTISNASGTATFNVANVSIVCSADTSTYKIFGWVTDLKSSGLKLTLSSNGVAIETLSLNSTASFFSFSKRLRYGSSYSVTITGQPTGQTCAVTGGQGTVSDGFMSDISVACAAKGTLFSVGGTLSGLTGSGLTLQLSDKTAGTNSQLLVAANATTFVFPTTLANGKSYAVAITTQPASNNCVVSNATGTISAANVTDVSILCTPSSNTAGFVVDRVEMAQALALKDTSSYLRITPQRDFLVRAFVRKLSSQTASAPVVLRTYSAAQNTWSDLVTMTCPTLTTSPSPTNSYNLADACYANVPAASVLRGGVFAVAVGDVTYKFSPPVIAPYKIAIVVVPLSIGGVTPSISAADLSTMQAFVQSRMPFAQVTVSSRASYTPQGGYAAGLPFSSDWSGALSELDDLRTQETDGTKFYYGFASRTSSSAYGGIGYRPGYAALGLKGNTFTSNGVNYDWSTFMHELGHNLSLMHAPCGGPANPDPQFPYSGARLSNAPLYVQTSKTLVDPTALAYSTDVMGYCNGTWFSDYNYAKMQDYMAGLSNSSGVFGIAALESTALSAAAPAGIFSEDTQSKISISGALTASGAVKLRPIQASTAPSFSSNAGTYTLKLYTQDNQSLSWNFELREIEDVAVSEKHFHVVVPDLGTLAAVEVWQGNKLLLTQGLSAAQRAEAARNANNNISSKAAAAVQPALINAQEVNGELRVQWNAAAWPNLQVIHDDAKGKKFVLTLGAQGGDVRLPLKDVTAGGWFDLSFSNGLQVQRSRVAR